MNIKNPNFICPKMQIEDVKYAFDIPKNMTVKKYIYDVLIQDGWVRKKSDRYYVPTEKLNDMAFLPEQVVLSQDQVRFLGYNSIFTKENLVTLFNSQQIVKQLIVLNYLRLAKTARYLHYEKTEKFDEFLADGENIIEMEKNK